MRIRNMLGLAAIGGLLYMHKKRGGEWTVESLRDSARQLWNGVQAGAEKAAEEAKRQLKEAGERTQQAGAGQQSTGYGIGTGDRYSR
jgi:hypothetical protein